MIVPVYENKSMAEWSFVNETSVKVRLLNTSIEVVVDFSNLSTFAPISITDKDVEINYFEIISVFEDDQSKFYIYIENRKIKVSNGFSLSDKEKIPLNIEFTDDRFKAYEKNGQLEIRDSKSSWEYIIDERLFSQKGTIFEDEMSYSGDIPGEDNPHVFFRFNIGDYHAYFEVYRGSKRYAMKYLKFKMFSVHIPANLKIEPISFNMLKISINGSSYLVKRDEVNNSSQVIGKIGTKEIPHPIYFEANGKFFSLGSKDGDLIITNAKRKDHYFIKTFRPKAVRLFKKMICFGKLKYACDTGSLDLTTVRTGSNTKLANMKRLGNFFWFSINLDDAKSVKSFHNRLWLGNFVHRLKVRPPFQGTSNKLITNYEDYSLFLRMNNIGILSLSVVPRSQQYEMGNRFKQQLAYYLVRFKKKFLGFSPKVNLYFEKDCSRAEESAIRVFQEVVKLDGLKSKNYFVLDERADYFETLKNKYGDQLVSRFSFKHYYLLFSATNFVSSELANHVVEVRVLNDKLSKKINSTPLYFLQHGIMFAKPVENPMARGFYKSDMAFTLKKSVISSDLEAGEFYKMGYNDSELMKTGLATFDYAVRDANADKIVYMPTYRYWEEKAIINGQIKETTYFFSIMEVIKAFEKEGLIDRLLITPHNKFSEYIIEYLPEYRDIICGNPSEALKQSCIFISDYSSAIYDAIYRGAYPIFYWKDEEYLIQNYQAVPPVNKNNAPGVISYDENQLVNQVKEAIHRGCVIEPENLAKYRKINEFHDGKNTERIISVLLEDGVL